MKTNEPKHESEKSGRNEVTTPQAEGRGHTPTPWKAAGSYFESETRLVGSAITMKGRNLQAEEEEQSLAKANAAFIVKAVNAHDALLEAVRLSLAMIKDRFISEHGMENVGAAWGACEKAVAKAEGK